jgi:hypothetical protein
MEFDRLKRRIPLQTEFIHQKGESKQPERG